MSARAVAARLAWGLALLLTAHGPAQERAGDAQGYADRLGQLWPEHGAARGWVKDELGDIAACEAGAAQVCDRLFAVFLLQADHRYQRALRLALAVHARQCQREDWESCLRLVLAAQYGLHETPPDGAPLPTLARVKQGLSERCAEPQGAEACRLKARLLQSDPGPRPPPSGQGQRTSIDPACRLGVGVGCEQAARAAAAGGAATSTAPQAEPRWMRNHQERLAAVQRQARAATAASGADSPLVSVACALGSQGACRLRESAPLGPRSEMASLAEIVDELFAIERFRRECRSGHETQCQQLQRWRLSDARSSERRVLYHTYHVGWDMLSRLRARAMRCERGELGLEHCLWQEYQALLPREAVPAEHAP